MVKYKMVLQYVGTAFHGWQVQKDRRTVQSCLQQAVERICGQAVSVVGAGRTDAGVHALGQVAHFRIDAAMKPARLREALNSVLPWDVRVRSLAEAPAGFHAQKDALWKQYDYRIYRGPVLSPFLSNRVLHLRRRLDVPAMQEAVALLEGTHDFSSFAAAASKVKNKCRTVREARFTQRGGALRFSIVGDGFLHHMVRNIVGTALEVGSGKLEAKDVREILRVRDRRRAGPTASPQGLYLNRIWYR